jgi:hypothetical protein
MAASDLPVAAGREVVRCLLTEFRLGVERHIARKYWVLSSVNKGLLITIPDHPEVKRDLLAEQLDLLGIDHRFFAKKLRP